jgi:hypothetical protein
MRSLLTFAPLFLAAATLLQACVYVPATTEVYDPDCQIVAKKMVLNEVDLGANWRCSNDGCIGLLVAAGATAAASAVVSGSIVIAGNVVYWLEKQGNCRRAS